MRLLVLALLLFSVVPAAAQDDVVSLICQAQPTQRCALEMAVKASLAVPPGENQTPPWGRIVETASRAGLLDIAIEVAPRMRKTDAIAIAEIYAAATRASRLGDIRPAMAALEAQESGYGFMIVPVLVELGRDAELKAFVATIQPPPHADSLEQWRMIGDLRAGQTDAVLARLDSIEDAARRNDQAYGVVVQLLTSETPEPARALAKFLQGEPAFVRGKTRLARALRDRDLALEALDALPTMPPEERDALVDDLVFAFADAGDWRKALELARTLPDKDQAGMLAAIAGASGEPEAFALLEQAINAATDSTARDRMRRMMVGSLIRAGYVSAAAPFIDQAGDADRENTVTSAAAALARTGHPAEALQLARSVSDPYKKAWAIWEVAHNIEADELAQ